MLRIEGLGFRAQGAGFRVQSAGFWVRGAGFWVLGVWVLEFKVQGSGCGVYLAPGKVDITLPGKGNSKSHGARPVYLDDEVDSGQ